MHKFVMWIFESLKNIEKFLRLVCVFFIMMLALYWIMKLIGSSWAWIGFISPALDGILDFVNGIFSFSFDFWGRTMEIKYFNALLLMLLAIGGLKAIGTLIDMLQEIYENAHMQYKKTNEKIFNYGLEKAVENDEKQKMQYMLFIQTRPARKYARKSMAVDMGEQNNLMNKFLSERLGVQPIESWDGFLYYLNNFERVDKVLDTIFRQMESPAPLEYFVCLQIGTDTKQLKTLVGLQEWHKIIMSAETLNRYKYNNVKHYTTSNIGIFQKEEGTLEVHEIREED